MIGWENQSLYSIESMTIKSEKELSIMSDSF